MTRATSIIQKFFVIGLFPIAFKRSRFVRPLGYSIRSSWLPQVFRALGLPYHLNNRYDCSHPHHKEPYPRSVIKTYDQPNYR